MRIITIDQGNSSLKAAVWQDGNLVASTRLFRPVIEDLLPLLEGGEIDGGIYCSVGHTDAKFLETLRRLIDGEFIVLTPATPIPIAVVYGSRGSLGNDRVAAAAGAADLYPGEGLLVVDAGTAVTLDVVDASPSFRGGNISPGMNLRFEALNRFTDRLPLVSAEGEISSFGCNTESAIRCGVVGGMVSEISDAFHRAREIYAVKHLVLTGNDAPILLPLLRERDIPVDSRPDLVGYGLLKIFMTNISRFSDI